MGEAKRRKELGLSPRKLNNVNSGRSADRVLSWLPFTKNQLSRYPYLPVVTMALGLFFLLVDWTKFNTAS